MRKLRCNIFALLREFKQNIDMKTFIGQLIFRWPTTVTAKEITLRQT